MCEAELPWLNRACRQCALPLSGPDLVCGACLAKPPAFDRAQALWRYQPPVIGAIYALKFHKRLELARALGEILARRLRLDSPIDCLVPIPLHPARYRARGFNQALEIARPLSKRFKLPLRPQLCRRLRDTPPQRTLSAEARRQNLQGAFEATADLSGRRIALIDDVLTTGATAHAVAYALKQAGAVWVEVWVLARA
ncbi:ComF family protein [Methylothermus subterraneus]